MAGGDWSEYGKGDPTITRWRQVATCLTGHRFETAKIGCILRRDYTRTIVVCDGCVGARMRRRIRESKMRTTLRIVVKGEGKK